MSERAPNVPDRVHLVGIGGAHMSAIAKILHAWGHTVRGSDQRASDATKKLEALGITVYIGHAAEHVGDAELVVFTSAAHEDNAEIAEARRRGIATIKRAEMVAMLMEGRYSIAVAGTHGKTTTSGLIAHMLVEAKLDHSAESPVVQAAEHTYRETKLWADGEFARIRKEIELLNVQNKKYQLVFTTSTGIEHQLQVSDVVRAYPANQLSWGEKLGIYASRWWEFLADDPREANSEGGVFPAIWGTVVMTLIMSLAVVPFGVLAALYLREYAKAGPVVSAVRIAINNLAGVPSIVFG
ncbi:MAG: Mur ligase domain-containing protein, partial [Dehalococcoidia bacterium]